MKILFISEYYPPAGTGGGEISCSLLAKYLSEAGVEIHLLTSGMKELKKHESLKSLHIHRTLKTGTDTKSIISNIKRRFRFPKSTAEEIIKICKKHKFSIIHCFNTNSIAGAVIAKPKVKLPVIAHINSSVLFCPLGTKICKEKECKKKCTLQKFIRCLISSEQVGNMQNRFYLRYNPIFMLMLYLSYLKNKNNLFKMDYFTPISQYMAESLNQLGLPKNKIKVVPNIIEADKFDIKIKTKRENSTPKILYIGSYVASKGPQILLKALKGIGTKAYECHFYGEGVLKSSLKKYAKANQLSVQIHSKVPYEKVPQIYSTHDIIVFPSLVPEAFGRIAIEANLAGKPLIASKIGGIANIVKDRETGILVSPGNPKELRSAIMEIISNKDLRYKIIKAGKTSAKELYSGQKIAGGVISIYEKVKTKG